MTQTSPLLAFSRMSYGGNSSNQIVVLKAIYRRKSTRSFYRENMLSRKQIVLNKLHTVTAEQHDVWKVMEQKFAAEKQLLVKKDLSELFKQVEGAAETMSEKIIQFHTGVEDIHP